MNLHDSLNILSKTSPQKLINAFKVYLAYLLSPRLDTSNALGLPISIAFEPTTSCNLRCPECPSGLRSFTRPTGMLEIDFFREKIQEMKSHLLYLTFYFQGEPYLHPQFLEMTQYATQNRIYTSTSTNAHYLNQEKAEATIKSGLDRLIISIDGISQNTYEQYRIGGNLAKVLTGTRNIIAQKRKWKSRTPHVIFQFLVVAPNEHQIDNAKQLAKEIGVDEIQFKSAQIYDYKNGSPLIPKNQKYSRYLKKNNGRYELKNKLANQCWKMWQGCVITWDGKVVPCCFDKDAKYVMGDLHNQSLADIWYSDSYIRFRKNIRHSRANIDICKNCSEGLNM